MDYSQEEINLLRQELKVCQRRNMAVTAISRVMNELGAEMDPQKTYERFKLIRNIEGDIKDDFFSVMYEWPLSMMPLMINKWGMRGVIAKWRLKINK